MAQRGGGQDGQVGQRRTMPVGSVPRFEPTRPLRYTMADIERESSVPARTVRYYVSEGLLPPAYGRGKQATYDADHLLRLQYIVALKDERLSLADIRERLGDMTPEKVAAAMRIDLEPAYESWRHYPLHDDLDVAIRDRPATERDPSVDQAMHTILEYARSVVADLDRRTGFGRE